MERQAREKKAQGEWRKALWEQRERVEAQMKELGSLWRAREHGMGPPLGKGNPLESPEDAASSEPANQLEAGMRRSAVGYATMKVSRSWGYFLEQQG